MCHVAAFRTVQIHGLQSGACEAGVSIKPGAQAPGSDHKDKPGARENGRQRENLTVFRPLPRAPALLLSRLPGASAPGFMPTPASQAKEIAFDFDFLCKATPTGFASKVGILLGPGQYRER